MTDIHIRQRIRDAVIARVTGLPTTGTRVFESRVFPQEQADLPCLRVYTIRDLRQRIDAEPITVTARVQVIVEALVESTNLEKTTDAIGLEVERALAAERLAGVCSDFYLEEATKALSGEADKQFGLLRMEFIAEADIPEADPGAAPV